MSNYYMREEGENCNNMSIKVGGNGYRFGVKIVKRGFLRERKGKAVGKKQLFFYPRAAVVRKVAIFGITNNRVT